MEAVDKLGIAIVAIAVAAAAPEEEARGHSGCIALVDRKSMIVIAEDRHRPRIVVGQVEAVRPRAH